VPSRTLDAMERARGIVTCAMGVCGRRRGWGAMWNEHVDLIAVFSRANGFVLFFKFRIDSHKSDPLKSRGRSLTKLNAKKYQNIVKSRFCNDLQCQLSQTIVVFAKVETREP